MEAFPETNSGGACESTAGFLWRADLKTAAEDTGPWAGLRDEGSAGLLLGQGDKCSRGDLPWSPSGRPAGPCRSAPTQTPSS